MSDRPDQEFAGKSAIITGGSSGIGLAIAHMLAARGAKLVIVGRDQTKLAHAAAAIGEAWDAKVEYVAGDAANKATADAAIACALQAYGKIDILANIAGWYPTGLVEHTSDADYQATIAANLTSTFAMCRAVVEPMRQTGGGAIVNISSTAARFPTPGLAAYSASKAGVEAFTRALAAEVAPVIRVNAVSAGPTLTDTVRALLESDTTGAVKAVTNALPMGRMAEPDEIAEAVVFLASSRARIITGQVLHANSGGHMA